MKQFRHIAYFLLILLLLGGVANKSWGAQITYHILTLPCKNTATVPDANGWVGNTRSDLDGYRQEAIKVVVNGSNVELPAYLKSPLAKNFTYYQANFVTKKSNTAEKVYEHNNDTRALFYSAPIAPYTKVTKSGESVTEVASNATAWGTHEGGTQKTATSLADYNTQKTGLSDGTYYFKMDCLQEQDPINVNTDIYVTYEYNPDNTIAKLDGTQNYNIKLGDYGFLALNRGRNNRPAVIPAAKIADHPEYLTSEDFVTIPHDPTKQEIPGTNSVQGYWKDDPYNTRSDIAYQFHFMFKYYGLDPYNITISSAYNTNKYYIEKYGNNGPVVKKWYKGSSLFAQNTATAFISSDDNKEYTQTSYSDPESEVTSTAKYGYYKGLGVVWNSFVLLYACDKDGHINENNLVLMGSRTVKTDKSGNLDYTTDKQYYLAREKTNNNNNWKFTSMSKQDAPLLDKKMYEIKTVNFKVKTPFGNFVTASIKLSEYTLGFKDIDVEDIPGDLKRKYCSFSKFHKDAALENEITSYKDAYNSSTGEYDVYVSYTKDMPFNALKPTDSYTTATWYELTDEGSSQENGKKIKYDGSANFKNNGAAGTYEKTTEFAFIGDPYEMRVLYRDATETTKANRYVGGSTSLGVSDTADDGYCWEIPNDNTNGSFLLRKMNGTGYWYWNADHLSESFSYSTKAHAYSVSNGNAQTLTFTINDLTYVNGHYIKVTKGGTNPEQVISTVPTLDSGKGAVRTEGTATVTVDIAASGGSSKSFTLTIQEYNGSTNAAIGDPTVITVTQAAGAYTGNTITYSTSNSTRIKLLELPKRNFTYNIVDKAGNIAAKATASQTIFSPLSVASIPSIILSPFILDEVITFYDTFDNGSGAGTGTSRAHLGSQRYYTPNTDAVIYVKYTTAKLNQKPANLSESQEFNVKLNGRYIYYDKTSHVLKTKDEPDADELKSSEYLWKLRNQDPYAMLIDNMAAREDKGVNNQTETVTVYDDESGTTSSSRQKGAWVTLASIDNAVDLSFTTRRSDESEGSGLYAQRFIAKSSTASSVYEVMVATDAVDASATASVAYYNIGCPEANTVRIYDNEHYAHGNVVLSFILNQNITFTYHLIDKVKHELLELTSKTPELALPTEYQSPLVETYHYYDKSDIDETSTSAGKEYKPKDGAVEITNLLAIYTKTLGSYSSEWEAAAEPYKQTATVEAEIDTKAREFQLKGHYYFRVGSTEPFTYYDVNVTQAFHNDIYVTYDKNHLVTFNSSNSPYMLKFLDPFDDGYYLEDGNDKLTKTKIQAVYPYCNGDGSLNVYGTAMNEEQMAGGSSTRPRWIWFFESTNDDPYHVKIHSKSEIEYQKTGVKHPTYLQTYAVHFNQDVSTTTSHIVTGGVLAGIASIEPTEYMILGTAGQYKLLTTNPVPVDLNGDGDTEDAGESAGVRHYVKSFEQYWKTYNMIKQCLLEINTKSGTYKDEYSNDETTWVVPTELRETLDTKLTEKGIGAGNWHSYDVIVNAVRWNGYNDKEKANTKLVEKLEHWFQTFDMGDGTFDIESADIPPVLVLLDRHGWEIMRKPLGYNSSAALDVLRSYDSPMVKEYKFYSNATKADGCHKYILRMQNGAERDQIKVNGVHYTSTSLADLPPETATGVKSSGAFNDQFVTYTVKEEYENSYQYHLELHEEDNTFEEWGTPSKFLVLQHNRFARNNADGSKPAYLSKPIYQGSGVSGDNGEVYDMILAPTPLYADPNRDGVIDNINLWYVGPNLNIDEEMGIKWGQATKEENEPFTEYKTKKEYKDKTGFDPYNIQLQLVDGGKYLSTDIKTTKLNGGAMLGNYTGGSKEVSLKDIFTSYAPSTNKGSEGYDHTNIQMSNQTFMAVSDANGNMQLMPRFDHSMRVNVSKDAPYLTTLEESVDHNSTARVDDWRSMGPQTTFLVRPQVFEYHIIDNEGNESLRYKTCGEYTPSITEHFRSPLATDFKYYFGYAAGTTSASSKESRDAAATSNYFKKAVASATAMETAAKGLTVLDDYYFKVTTENYNYVKVNVTTGYVAGPPPTYAVYTVTNCTESDYDNATGEGKTKVEDAVADDAALVNAAKELTSTGDFYYKVNTYNYKKVTLTKAHSEDKDATYTTTDCAETEWENAVAYQQSSTDDADFVSDAKALTNKGLHYFQIGPTTLYRKVTVDGDTKTVEESNETDWTSHASGTQETVADMTAYKTAIGGSLAEGTHYYKITAYYSYKKVVVTNTNDSFSTEVKNHKDISNREISGTFAEAGLNDMTNQVYVRYSYDVGSDVDEILQGKWFTIKLANKDVQATGTLNPEDGTGVSLYTGEKPVTIDGAETARRIWQWKFLAAPVESTSDYNGTLDPYAVRIFNRAANYTTDLTLDPNPMGVGIKVNGTDRFALLSHKDGGYAFAVAKEYPNYDYYFLNGAGMTVPSTTAATTYPEYREKMTVADDTAYGTAKDALTADGEYYFKIGADTYKKVTKLSETLTEDEINESAWNAGDTYHFTINSNALSPGTQLMLNDDVTYNYTYKVINNAGKLAVSDTQDKDGASEHSFVPYLPSDIQSKLLDIDKDYLYYGSAAESDGTYTVVPATKLVTLFGLYNDEVFVRYKAYDMDGSKYEVPNKKTLVGGKVAKDPESKDAALNINDGLPYNIIWESDNMMRSNDGTETDVTGDYIKGKAGQDLQADGTNGYVWKFQGNDPYALKIYNGKQGKYIHAASAENDAACTLTDTPTEFMLLKRDGYEYGVFEMTGHKGSKLTMTDDNGTTLGVAKITTSDPKYFIIFGLSTHKLIYHLVIAKTCPDKTADPLPTDQYVDIPYRTVESGDLTTLRIFGTTQRDLSDTYQLGSTILGKSYSYDAGEVSIGDVLKVPTVFDRPNCVFFFYVDNIQTAGATTFQKTVDDITDYATGKEKIGSTGYYYFKIGTSDYIYKRVRVTKVSPREYEEFDCTEDDYNNAWQDNTTLNNKYKGLEITKLMSEPDLIGSMVQINIGYAFQTGLETNAGEGFVTDVSQNLWYTFEAKHDDGTPYLAHYTNAWGLQAMAGRDTRYTNDYLWTPLGDVYGFKMYNRYMIKNSNGAANVMTMPTISEGTNLKMAIPDGETIPYGYEVFELLGSNTDGYFRIHPVINHGGTQYYVRKNPSDNYAKLSTSYSEWTFNLPPDLLKPYIERKGYVGGLKESSYTANKTILDKVLDGTATYAEMLTVQGIVYNDDNIVSYTPGYYRLHSQPGVSGISPVRYASGYLHKTELTGDGHNTTGPIPLHFYSKVGTSTTFGDSGLKYGYTQTYATQGDIPIVPTESDPSTIFYFSGTETLDGNPRSTMQTQELYVAANANGDTDNGTTTNRLQRAVMSDNSANAITFSLMDIGGAVLLIHDGATAAQRRYLNFDQSNTFQKTATDDADMIAKAKKFTSIGTYYFKIDGGTYMKLKVTSGYVAGPPETDAVFGEAESSDETEWTKAADIYDLKYYHDSPTDDAKWCMVSADSLMITTHKGGDGYYYTTFCAPFDVQLPNDVAADADKETPAKDYYAYICTEWNTQVLHPKKVGQFNTGTHEGDNKFIPAGTPVIIRTTDNSESVKLTFPSTSPTSALNSCIFTGKYLEQLLDGGGGNEVYTLGLPFTSTVEKAKDYNTNGEISAPLPEQANNGIGFYINATPNKEHNASKSLWLRNNRYVLHNKIYYRVGESSGSSARGMTRSGIEFVPLIFDWEEVEEGGYGQQEEEDLTERREYVGDGCVYDMQGRRVATEQQVLDGTWKQRVSPGIYIINGKKISVN